MTQDEFVKLKEKYSKKWADAHFNSFKKYDWDKFIRIEDASTQFSSTRRKYALYKDNVIITPYLNETGNYKPYQGKDSILTAQYEEFDSEGDYGNFYSECQKDISTRWNIWEFTLYPSGEYESSFIWDNEANLDILNDQVWAFLHYLGEYLENCFLDFPNIYPDWVSSDVKLISKSGKYFAEGIAINKTSQVPFNFALSDNFNADYFQMQVESLDKELDYLWKSTNTAELKERFKPWNALILHLEYLRYFDAEVYTEFIFEENA